MKVCLVVNTTNISSTKQKNRFKTEGGLINTTFRSNMSKVLGEHATKVTASKLIDWTPNFLMERAAPTIAKVSTKVGRLTEKAVEKLEEIAEEAKNNK